VADGAGRIDYGRARSAGSAAFVVANLLGGAAIARYGDAATAAWIVGASSLIFLAALALPDLKALHGGKPSSWREAPRLLSRPLFLLLLLSAGLTQGAHAAYYGFSILHWTSLGLSPGLVGVLWATGVVAEVGLIYKGGVLMRRIGPTLLIAVGAGAAVGRWLLTASEPALPILFFAQTLHALTFGATFLGALAFVRRTTPTRLQNTAMTLLSTTGVGAATGLATVAAGMLYDRAGAPAAYLLMAGMAAVSLAGALLLRRLWSGGMIFE